MARPAALKLGLLLALVLAAHAATLDWVSRHLEPVSVLKPMVPAMYTRLLAPEAPKPVAEPAPPPPAPVKRRSIAAVKPASPASTPVAESPPATPAMPATPEPPVATTTTEDAPGTGPLAQGVPLPAASAPQAAAASSPQAPASTPVAAADAPASAPTADPLASWPSDTRLSYRLGGRFRSGELYGDAQVAWQRAGGDYQVRIDVDITLLAKLIMASQGRVTPQGLQPRAYEEIRPGRKTRAASFGESVLALENGKTATRPEGMQDTASQFVELSHRFATGRDKLEVGHVVRLWMARPGAVDLWTYDIVERETLQMPKLGAVEAFRLVPRPIANPRGNFTVEMWFAPTLQYLPVRIKLMMGDEAHIDLLVDRIEQR